MLSPGSKAPPFSLNDPDGSPHSLADLLSRGPILVVLYKISCPTCQFTLPFLDRIKGSPQIVAISQDDASGTRRFRTKYGLTMLTLLDRQEEGYPVSNAFGIAHVPSLFLVEADGTISHTAEGFVKADLEAIGVPFRADEAVPAWKAG
jgi:peroxiredoxin